jgi:alanine-glyoxylate transaminase/serine-glyoxylate transaminase/serine-pyruvate transaminase
MIPGPIEFDPSVMTAMGAPTTSHVAPDFIETFGNSLQLMKKVWCCPSGQPFVVAGSGTLAMDMAAANLIEPGDRALVISTGYFGDRFVQLIERYGAEVTVLASDVGDVVGLDLIEAELARSQYKLMTITHVDTSTAVRVDPEPIAKLASQHGVLSVLDGVCSVAGEKIRQEEWGLDVVLTASQKAVGVPPGLALMVVSPKAIETWRKRQTPVGNYYADWTNWLPIMTAYAERRPSYFGTPPVNLISALQVSLTSITDEGLDRRFKRHQECASAFRAAMKALGLAMIPATDSIAANTLSAPYYPQQVDGGAFLADVGRAGVIVAGGLLADLKSRYFRVGHMGSVSADDILTTVGAIESALKSNDHRFETGVGLTAVKKILVK